MKVKLIAHSQPVEGLDVDLKDVKELIAYCARVSNPSNQSSTETSDKLIKYLVKHKHWSPMEMASATLEIETSRDIARQLLRHRSFSFQEFSQRYADPTKDMDFVIREARFQDTKNRQNSVELDLKNDWEKHVSTEWKTKQQEVIDLVKQHYNWAVSCGIAKEQARVILPEGNTVSRLYVQGTIRSYIHYIEVRTGVETQKEHRELALAVAKAISTIFKID